MKFKNSIYFCIEIQRGLQIIFSIEIIPFLHKKNRDQTRIWQRNLVIVESPAKAKTIENFLGKDFRVESSFGHIADLPSSELGINVDGDFRPKYIVSEDKKAVVKKLATLAKKARNSLVGE